MTAYATRAPLALVTNTADAMGGTPRRSARRSSARLAEKEDELTPTKEAAATTTTTAPKRNAKATATGTGATVQADAKGNGRKGKRKLDYDEDDDGFMFTRTKTKKPRASKSSAAATATAVQPLPAEEEPEPKPLQVRKSRTKNAESAGQEESSKETPPRKGRGRPPKAKGDDIFGDDAPRRKERAHTPEPKAQTGGDVTKIALPFADTPVIRRNKEMRKKGADGSRRSSLSMRGRRASSLIDSGTSNALPHAEVPASEFYKHIESGLPEPRRMRQLLTWCATRALGEKPAFGTKDSNAQLAAHAIKQQLLQDFSAQSELSDWFSREDRPRGAQTLRPNPRNIANQAKIKDLETRIARLKAERETWSSLLKPSPTPLLTQPPSSTLSSDLAQQTTHLLEASDLSALSVLTLAPAATSSAHNDPSSSSISATSPSKPLSTQQPSGASATATDQLGAHVATRAAAVAARAEFDVDRLADTAHVLAQHLALADGVGRRVLRGVADALEARHHHRSHRSDQNQRGHQQQQQRPSNDNEDGAAEVGTRDVLRALSFVDP